MTGGRPRGSAQRRTPLATAVVVLLGALLTLSACVSLPEDGPVVESDLGRERDDRRAADFEPKPPPEGASRQAIVTGFLDAMTAWPVQISAAKKYLTEESAESWNPENGMIVYTGASTPQESGGTVTVQLGSADRLDANGGWRGAVPDAELRMTFEFAAEDGEFRIKDPRNALVVPSGWFEQRFRQEALYYFDPIAQILVPEPVFVPVGEQLATTLVSELLEDPPARLRDIVRTFIPSGLSAGLSVPVTDDGVAQIDLTGGGPRPRPPEAERMLAQLAWTLRQDPEVLALRVTIDGEPLALPSGASVYEVDEARDFDPTGSSATPQLYGLRNGRAVFGSPTHLRPASGPFGRREYRLVDLAVAPGPDRAAGVTADRATVLVAPVRAAGDARARTVLDGGARIAEPTWDYVGRLWLLDRTAGGAHLYVVGKDGYRARPVLVDGVTGRDVRQIKVSRDGTRLVAVIHDGEGDRVVASRVVLDRKGRVDRVTPAVVFSSASGLERILDIAWTSPTTLAVLTPARPGSLFEVDTVVADGASVGVDTASTILSGKIRALAGSPAPDLPTYAVLETDVIDVDTRETADFEWRMDDLDYAG